MARLVITHGETVTEHELGSQPLVIGRDPSSDLFFADKKLSRHHARIEQAGGRFRLVDLDSRNGSWVNEELVEEPRLLAPGDVIRLGGLRVSFDDDSEAEASLEESTVYITEDPGADDTSTVLLPAAGAAAADESSTVFLESSELSSSGADALEEETIDRPPSSPGGDQTVLLPGEGGFVAHDTGTVILKGKADPQLSAARAAAEPRASLLEEGDATVLRPSYDPGNVAAPFAGGHRSASWLMLALLSLSVATLAVAVLGLPLSRALRGVVVEEFTLKGRTLLDWVVARNEAALAEGRTDDLVVERAATDPGVRGIWVLAPTGRVLAATDGSAETLAIEGIGTRLETIRAYYLGQSLDGDYVMAQPILLRGRRIGVAVVALAAPAVGSSFIALLLVAGFILTALAVAAVLILWRRMSLVPIQALKEDIEALREGRSSALSEERPDPMLSELARSVNRLASPGGASSRGQSHIPPTKPARALHG